MLKNICIKNIAFVTNIAYEKECKISFSQQRISSYIFNSLNCYTYGLTCLELSTFHSNYVHFL